MLSGRQVSRVHPRNEEHGLYSVVYCCGLVIINLLISLRVTSLAWMKGGGYPMIALVPQNNTEVHK